MRKWAAGVALVWTLSWQSELPLPYVFPHLAPWWRPTPVSVDQRTERFPGEAACRAALERHLALLRGSSEAYAPGLFRRDDGAAVLTYARTDMVKRRVTLACADR